MTVVGAGLSGLIVAAKSSDIHQSSVVIFEKAGTIGGVWRQHANAFSRVNSSEPSYRLPVASAQANSNHSHHSEILSDILRLVEQYKLSDRIHVNTEVSRVVSDGRDGWRLAGHCNEQPFTLTSRMAVLCTNRRLGQPRHMRLSGEDKFGGQVFRGLSGDVNTLQCAGERVLVLGMGAFAIENMRTSFERRAAHVTILCRRRGTVCPQLVDWLNFVRPFDDDFRHDAAGDAVVLSHWHGVYDSSGARRPECWSEGLLKPDGHTVSVSDLFFIAHHVKMLETACGEVSQLESGGARTRDGSVLSAGVVIKCVGFELNEGNERLLGRTRMRPTTTVERNLWLQIETHFDKSTFNSPFGSSYLNAVAFNAKVMSCCWRDPQLHERLLREELVPVRINTFSASEGMDGIQRADPRVSQILHHHVQEVASDFDDTMPLREYVQWNAEQWRVLHGMLGHATGPLVMPYRLPKLLQELRIELRAHDTPTDDVLRAVQGSNSDAPVHILVGVPPEEHLNVLIDLVQRTVDDHAADETIDADTAVASVGLDSLGAVELVSQLRAATGIEDLTPTILLANDATVRSVAASLLDHVREGESTSDEASMAAAAAVATAEHTSATPLPAACGSVALDVAPEPPVLSGRVIVVLAAPWSGIELFSLMLRGDKLFVPFELHLLPYATMEERAAHLKLHLRLDAIDPLMLAIAELRACSLDDAHAFAEALGPGLPTARMYEELLALAHPRVLVDATPTNAEHINFPRRAARMFGTEACFVHVARHPIACVAEAASRGACATAEAEERWLQGNALIDEFVEDVHASQILAVRHETLRCGVDRLVRRQFADAWGLVDAESGSSAASETGGEVHSVGDGAPSAAHPHAWLPPLLQAALYRCAMSFGAGAGALEPDGNVAPRDGMPPKLPGSGPSGETLVSTDTTHDSLTSGVSDAQEDGAHATSSDEPLTLATSSEDERSSAQGEAAPQADVAASRAPSVPRTQSVSQALRPRAPQLPSMRSATKLMARRLGFHMPAHLPADCCWMALPLELSDSVPRHRDESTSALPRAPSSSHRAPPPMMLFPGILGGPDNFADLVPRMRGPRSGAIALRYSSALLSGCASWHDLIGRCAALARQLCRAGAGPLRLVAYSFGCRIAYAVAARLAADGCRVQLVLIDGPIGGARGSFEKALLSCLAPPSSSSSSAAAAAAAASSSALTGSRGGGHRATGGGHSDEAAVATQLLTLLSAGGEEEPSEPLSPDASVELFVASDDQVGLDAAHAYLPAPPVVRRVRGGHRDIMRGRGAREVGELLSRAWSGGAQRESNKDGKRHA